jgi:2-amino-4-hydroxy-6-hydroxymethyldihydropteridine diphosphokinase
MIPRPIPSVERRQLWLHGVLAVGSNLGDRLATLEAAVDDLRATDGIDVVAVSRLYETVAVKPQGIDTDAPGYLNGVVGIRSRLSPEELLDAVGRIENAHGRVRTERWGDRTLDIDIITLGGFTLDTPRLTLPHPRAAERDFVLVPWLEIEPDAELPGAGRIDALLGDLPMATVRPYEASRPSGGGGA